MSIIGYNKDSMAVESKPTTENPFYLPPSDVWQFTPGHDEPLPTPVDERGLVDADALIALVKATVDSDFTWEPSEKPDAHHLYWERNLYPSAPKAAINPDEFCNLSINQIVIPRMFHNWLHLVTSEPPVPTKEVMGYRIEAHDTVLKLFRNAKQSVDLTRARYIPEERLHRGSEHHLWQFLIEVEEAQKLPVEFHPINFSDLNPSTPEELRSLAHFLGKAIARTNRARDVRSTLAPYALKAASATLVP